MKKLFFCFMQFVFATTSFACSNGEDKFVGTWIDCSRPSFKVTITKNNNEYVFHYEGINDVILINTDDEILATKPGQTLSRVTQITLRTNKSTDHLFMSWVADHETHQYELCKSKAQSAEIRSSNMPTSSRPSSEPKTAVLKAIGGNWSGKVIQNGVSKPYVLKLSCKTYNNQYTIRYPSFGCSGVWNIESASDSAINFREQILSGICVDGGLIRLILKQNQEVECQFFRQNSSKINARAVLEKE
jgi:hypothetical protein